MLKLGIFAAGTIAGAVALPASIVYVKPVRRVVSKVLGKGIAHILVNDEGARKTVIDLGSEALAGIIFIDEAKKAR